LQPVQLVSMEAVPGVTEKAAFEELAVTRPVPQPAANTSAGARSIGRFLKNGFRIVTIFHHSLSADSKLYCFANR